MATARTRLRSRQDLSLIGTVVHLSGRGRGLGRSDDSAEGRGPVVPTRYELVSSTVVGEHIFECFDVIADDDLIDEGARIVAELYVDPDTLMDSLRRASADLDSVASPGELASLMSEVAAAVIPQMDLAAERVHLQTPRNEVAEILAFDVLR